MAQERYQQRQQIDRLDKVEPYGQTAEARAASETSNLLARTTSTFARLLGNQSEKMAVRAAKRAAFKIDPETGTPMLPDKMMIGGLNATQAYQKTLGARYEKSLADSLNEKLMTAATNNLDDEAGFRQEMAIVVGAMSDKIDPQYQTYFTDMAGTAISDHAGKIAYRLAQREAAEARSAARQSAARQAAINERNAILASAPEGIRAKLEAAYMDSPTYAGMAEFSVEYANVSRDAWVDGKILEAARYNKKSTGVFAFPEIEPLAEAPEVQTDITGNVSEAMQNANVLAGVEANILQHMEAPVLQEDAIRVPGVDSKGRGIDVSPASEPPQPPLEETRPALTPQGSPPVGVSPYEAESGRNVWALNNNTAEGQYDPRAAAVLQNAQALTAAPFSSASVAFAAMNEKQQAVVMESSLPGSSSPGYWANPANLDTSKHGPVAARMIDLVQEGHLPPSVGNFFKAAIGTAGDGTQLLQAVQIWNNVGHRIGRDSTWATNNPTEAATMDALAITANNFNGQSSEELFAALEQVRLNAADADPQNLLTAMGVDYDGSNPRLAVRSEIQKRVNEHLTRPVVRIGFGSPNTLDDPKFAPERVGELIDYIEKVSYGLNSAEVGTVMSTVLNNNYHEVGGFVDGSNNNVKGVLFDDYPKIYTQQGEDPVGLVRMIASRALEARGQPVDPTDMTSLKLMPTGDGAGYFVYHNGLDTGLELNMNMMRNFVQGHEAFFMQFASEEYGDLLEQRNMLIEELAPTRQFNPLNAEEQEIYDMKREEINDIQIMMQEIGNYSMLDTLRDMPVSQFNMFIGVGPQ